MRIIRAGRYLFSLGLQVDRGRLLRAVVLIFAGYIAFPEPGVHLDYFEVAELQ